ncbi:hypothetical protein OKW41_000690 [Paraburkholderia sp. UCT70]
MWLVDGHLNWTCVSEAHAALLATRQTARKSALFDNIVSGAVINADTNAATETDTDSNAHTIEPSPSRQAVLDSQIVTIR